MIQELYRIVPNIYSDDPDQSKEFYTDFLGMDLVMDMKWILTFASKTNATSQISILQNDKDESVNNDAVFLSIEVADVDALYKDANKRKLIITYALANEPWGVRRFFVKDPNGATLNLLSHTV